MAKRGRPKKVIIEEPPRIFTRVYEDDVTKEVWSYNLDKFSNGPICVDITHKKKWDVVIPNEQLPKTKRKYYNPDTGKEVGYTRAKILNLI